MNMFKKTLLAAATVAIGSAASAQEPQFFRIGTGGTAGTYYPIGGLIANAISNPPGSRPCDEGGSCGYPGLIASALSANGSVNAAMNLAPSQGVSAAAAGLTPSWCAKPSSRAASPASP